MAVSPPAHCTRAQLVSTLMCSETTYFGPPRERLQHPYACADARSHMGSPAAQTRPAPPRYRRPVFSMGASELTIANSRDPRPRKIVEPATPVCPVPKQERSRTLSGRPGAPPRPLPGRSEGLLAPSGSLPGRPGVPPWRVRMGFSRSLGADAIFRRFLFDFLMKIRLFISNDFWMIVDRSTTLSSCRQ